MTKLIGTKKAEYLMGTDGDDIIKGGGGSDVIDGRDGADILYGGKGRDTFLFRADQVGVDTIMDFQPGKDRIIVSGVDNEPPLYFIVNGIDGESLLYDNGKLFSYAIHNIGEGSAVGEVGQIFATLDGSPDLQAVDLIVI